MNLTALSIDDFWKTFKNEGEKHLLGADKSKRGPEARAYVI